MSYDWEAQAAFDEQHLADKCWHTRDGELAIAYEYACDKPATNGAGLCDYHFKMMREEGK